jgi:hypothetical protein
MELYDIDITANTSEFPTGLYYAIHLHIVCYINTESANIRVSYCV